MPQTKSIGILEARSLAHNQSRQRGLGPWARQADGAPMGQGLRGGHHSPLYQQI